MSLTVCCVRVKRSVGSKSYCLRPCSMREKSRTFSMSEDRRRHSWTMKRKYSCCLVDSDTLPRARLSAIKRTEAMGERNSWETLETKLVFSSLDRKSTRLNSSHL